MRSLWFQQNIKEAIDGPRVHHQVVPMVVEYEYGISQVIFVTVSSRKGYQIILYVSIQCRR